MWIRIRAVIIEDEPLAAQYLAELLDETCQVEVVGSAAESEAGLRLCSELRPDAVFVDINLPGKDGVSQAPQCLTTTIAGKIQSAAESLARPFD
jgi:two-component system, LytTR family, response regulator LytT